MAKDFNRDQQEFVNSMGTSFREFQGLSSEQIWTIIGMVIFILGMILVYFGLKYQVKIRNTAVYLRKRLLGESVTHDRNFQRFDVAIRLPDDTVDRTQHGHTENVSPRGMFLKLNPPLKQGEIFTFTMVTPPGRISGTAEVRWVQPKWSEHHPTGIGCRFLKLGEEGSRTILKLLGKI